MSRKQTVDKFLFGMIGGDDSKWGYVYIKELSGLPPVAYSQGRRINNFPPSLLKKVIKNIDVKIGNTPDRIDYALELYGGI